MLQRWNEEGRNEPMALIKSINATNQRQKEILALMTSMTSQTINLETPLMMWKMNFCKRNVHHYINLMWLKDEPPDHKKVKKCDSKEWVWCEKCQKWSKVSEVDTS